MNGVLRTQLAAERAAELGSGWKRLPAGALGDTALPVLPRDRKQGFVTSPRDS